MTPLRQIQHSCHERVGSVRRNKAISELEQKNNNSMTNSPSMSIFKHLSHELDARGTLSLSQCHGKSTSISEQSFLLLFLCDLVSVLGSQGRFGQGTDHKSTSGTSIVHRPHPWSLLCTLLELIRNKRYNFWSHSFTQCATEISV